MSAAAAIQARVAAQERYDAIDYGLRSIADCGGEYFAAHGLRKRYSFSRGYAGRLGAKAAHEDHAFGAAHQAQLARACEIGAAVLGRDAIHADGSSATFWLKQAKRRAREELKAAKVAVAEFGNVRQLRLAVAA